MKSICKCFSWKHCALQKVHTLLQAKSVILHGLHHMDIFITTLHKIFLKFPGRHCFTCHQQTQSLLQATPDTHAEEKKKNTNNHPELFHKPYLLCTAEIRAGTCDGWGRHWSPPHAELSLKTTHSLHQGFPWFSPAVQDSFPHKFPDAPCQHGPLCYHIWSILQLLQPKGNQKELLVAAAANPNVLLRALTSNSPLWFSLLVL